MLPIPRLSVFPSLPPTELFRPAMRYVLPTRLVCSLILLASLVAGTVRGESSASEPRLLADAADGRLDRTSLLDAAVIAGGVQSPREVQLVRRKLDATWLEVGEPLIEKLPREQRPQAILTALHRLVLTGKYKAECTEVDRTLESGDYNCVTATVLYLELCRRHGIDGVAVAIPGHVYCRLQLAKPCDVQTTCRNWFDVQAGRAKSVTAESLSKQIASQSVEPRELTDVQLLGKIFYNRGVNHLEAHDYADAIALLKTSIALDQDDQPARNNLLAAHNNWALELCDTGKFAEAAEKLTQGSQIDAQYQPLQTNDLYVHQKWVLQLCDQGHYSAALEVLERGYQRRPDAPLFDGGRYAIYGMWARKLLEANRLSDALAVMNSARQRHGDGEELLKHEVQAFEAAIDHLARAGDVRSAQHLLATALKRHPSAESLREVRLTSH